MTAENVIKIAGNHNFTRREFLSTSCLAMSGTALALSTQKLPGSQSTTSNAMPNIDPKDFGRKITPRTKAVIAVHLLETPCDMDPIMQTAREHGVAVLEDCAQCVGGSYHGRKLGSIGDVGIYSFQVNKMITSGEGGAVVTSDPAIYERAARFHDMGTMRRLFLDRSGPSRVETFAGENFRMNVYRGRARRSVVQARFHADPASRQRKYHL